MKKRILSIVVVAAVVFGFAAYIWAHSASDFELLIENQTLKAYNDSGVEVDSFRITVYFYDSNDNVIETETYRGDDFPVQGSGWTAYFQPLDYPQGTYYATATMRVTLIDSTTYYINGYEE